jgi:hypothetical protein
MNWLRSRGLNKRKKRAAAGKMGGGENPPATRLKCENIALYRMYTPWSTAFVGSAPFASIVKLFKGKYARRDQWFTH